MRKQYLSTFYLFPKYAFLIRAIIVGQNKFKQNIVWWTRLSCMF